MLCFKRGRLKQLGNLVLFFIFISTNLYCFGIQSAHFCLIQDSWDFQDTQDFFLKISFHDHFSIFISTNLHIYIFCLNQDYEDKRIFRILLRKNSLDRFLHLHICKFTYLHIFLSESGFVGFSGYAGFSPQNKFPQPFFHLHIYKFTHPHIFQSSHQRISKLTHHFILNSACFLKIVCKIPSFNPTSGTIIWLTFAISITLR